MPSLNLNNTVTGLGANIGGTAVRTADGGGSLDPTIPKGYSGSLTTRTDNNTGTVTLSAGHAITTGMKVDIYWTGGVQYDVTVGTVSVNSMPFDLGVGANLPAQDTAVIVSPRVTINCTIDGDVMPLLAMKQEFADASITALSHIDFHDAAADLIAAMDLEANVLHVYDIDGGASNPFIGDVITVAYASNSSTTTGATLRVVWLQDSTP
jgi:hypothetical protein